MTPSYVVLVTIRTNLVSGPELHQPVWCHILLYEAYTTGTSSSNHHGEALWSNFSDLLPMSRYNWHLIVSAVNRTQLIIIIILYLCASLCPSPSLILSLPPISPPYSLIPSLFPHHHLLYLARVKGQRKNTFSIRS